MTAISGALIALLAMSGATRGADSAAPAAAAQPRSTDSAALRAMATSPAGPASAPTPVAAAVSPVPPSLPASVSGLPADTPVLLEIQAPLSSAKAKRGDKFPLRLTQALIVGGAERLPAGTPGIGEVVHAARRGASGKPGELLLAARYLEHQGRRVPLRGFSLGGTGKSREGVAVSVGIALGIPGLFVTGGEIEIPAGTQAGARTAQAVDWGSGAPVVSDSIVPAATAPSAGTSTSAATSITGEVVQ